MLDDIFDPQVEREIAIMTGLRHPHIVPLVGSEKSVEKGSNGLLIFMEFASGGSLAEHVMKTKKLGENEAGWCLEQVSCERLMSTLLKITERCTAFRASLLLCNCVN